MPAPSYAGIAAAALTAWFSFAALITLVLEPTRTAAVFAPAPLSLSALALADAQLLGVGTGFILVQGQHNGFVRQLYAGGGLLMLPTLISGCRGGEKLRTSARDS